MFFAINLKPYVAFLLIIVSSFILAVLLVNALSKKTDNVPLLDYTIVLDAGHGGVDGGCVGVNTKVKESDLNLSIVKKLEKYLKSFGFKVVLTRHDHNGLYNVFNRDYKLQDMSKRKEIIKKANANMVISIHLNAFPNKTSRGAQAFYDSNHANTQNSKELAQIIQDELIKNFENARKSISSGDYYILKCTNNPSVMIECGYLSNPEEEMLLQQEDYQQKLAYTIFCGIVKYFQNVYTGKLPN